MPFEYPGVVVFNFFTYWAKGDGTGNISSAFPILPAGVEQE